MRYIRTEVLQLFDNENKERRKRLNSFIGAVQNKLMKVWLKNPISINMDLSASLHTLHKNRSHGKHADWEPIRKHCRELNIVDTSHFGILVDGRVCVNISVKGEEDFFAVANVVPEFKISGYDEAHNFLWILNKDILIIFWYRLG